ncbi:MAG: TonB-dependent receptor [Sedimentisphaerales bacterium]|nr:TonB-dependent receptor [Sedimentisphaerales bacterium]
MGRLNTIMSVCMLTIVFGMTKSLHAEEHEDLGLFGLPFEQVMDMEVISVTRCKGQDVFSSPASIYVITQEDIRRSGLGSLPELLRLVPGIHVARSNASLWAISSRGFTSRYGRMLLVQLDGRIIYNPMTSGVRWEMQDVVLEDIERIEVIRGPGATLWGSNAVNGIINIVTKNAKDTQGTLLSGGFGSELRGFSTIRYGDKLNENTYYRVYGKYTRHDDFPPVRDKDFTDDWWRGQSGIRFDWTDKVDDEFNLMADIFEGRRGNAYANMDIGAGSNFTTNNDAIMREWNIFGRWNHTYSETSRTQLQMYYTWNRASFPDPAIRLRDDMHLFDLDFQHNLTGDGYNLVWGVGYRMVHGRHKNAEDVIIDPVTRTVDVFSGFIQDSIDLIEDELTFSVGSKLEYNDFTGFECQPSVRLAWIPNEHHCLWGAVSRAVRVPGSQEEDMSLAVTAVQPDMAVWIVGSQKLKSDTVIAYEMGYRVRPSSTLFFDVTAFFNDYDHLRAVAVDPDNPLIQRLNYDQTGQTYGLEWAANWNVCENLLIQANYTWLDVELHGDKETLERATPQNMAGIHSFYDITKDLELNTLAYYNDQASAALAGSYIRMDVGLNWHVSEQMEIGVWGQNLLDNTHPEYKEDVLSSDYTEVPRSYYVQMTYRF